jgi:hypothetical protein
LLPDSCRYRGARGGATALGKVMRSRRASRKGAASRSCTAHETSAAFTTRRIARLRLRVISSKRSMVSSTARRLARRRARQVVQPCTAVRIAQAAAPTEGLTVDELARRRQIPVGLGSGGSELEALPLPSPPSVIVASGRNSGVGGRMNAPVRADETGRTFRSRHKVSQAHSRLSISASRARLCPAHPRSSSGWKTSRARGVRWRTRASTSSTSLDRSTGATGRDAGRPGRSLRHAAGAEGRSSTDDAGALGLRSPRPARMQPGRSRRDSRSTASWAARGAGVRG